MGAVRLGVGHRRHLHRYHGAGRGDRRGHHRQGAEPPRRPRRRARRRGRARNRACGRRRKGRGSARARLHPRHQRGARAQARQRGPADDGRFFATFSKSGATSAPDMYDLLQDKPLPVIPRERRLCVSERITADGEVLTEPDHRATHRVFETLRDTGAEAVAVCFLNSYVNPGNEAQVRDWLRQALPGVHVCASYEVCREVPGIRTNEHRGVERRGHAAGGPVPRRRRAAYPLRAPERHGAVDAVERRLADGGSVAGVSGAPHHVWAGRWRARRAASRQGRRGGPICSAWTWAARAPTSR